MNQYTLLSYPPAVTSPRTAKLTSVPNPAQTFMIADVSKDLNHPAIIILGKESDGSYDVGYRHGTRYPLGRANLAFMDIQVAEGGAERFESVANALKLLKEDAELVAIHDAVRPCVTTEMIDAVFARAAQTGAAILGVPVSDTVKRVDDKKHVLGTMPRQGLWLAQTPQVFRRDWLVSAYADRARHGGATDDAQLVEAAGHTVHVVEGSASNLKITTASDVALAKAILQSRPAPKPTGPAHPFAEEEQMWR